MVVNDEFATVLIGTVSCFRYIDVICAANFLFIQTHGSNMMARKAAILTLKSGKQKV